MFAVGDRKQSIYSFQGADPAEFDRWRGRMRSRVGRGRRRVRDTALDVSFRSTPPVLALVDAVFADPAAPRAWPPGETLRHEAHRAGQAGRVELWPLAPLPPDTTPEPWAVPDRNHGLASAPQRLADALAPGSRRRSATPCCEAAAGCSRRRRAGAGAPARRFRPRPGAAAEGAAACRWPGSTGCI